MSDAKEKKVDYVTVGMVVFGIVLVIAMSVHFTVPKILEANQQKIAVFDTVNTAKSLEGASDEEVSQTLEQIESQARSLAEDGYVVIRSESIWDAPEEKVIEAPK